MTLFCELDVFSSWERRWLVWPSHTTTCSLARSHNATRPSARRAGAGTWSAWHADVRVALELEDVEPEGTLGSTGGAATH